jgi:hypothetical protein
MARFLGTLEALIEALFLHPGPTVPPRSCGWRFHAGWRPHRQAWVDFGPWDVCTTGYGGRQTDGTRLDGPSTCGSAFCQCCVKNRDITGRKRCCGCPRCSWFRPVAR